MSINMDGCTLVWFDSGSQPITVEMQPDFSSNAVPANSIFLSPEKSTFFMIKNYDLK